MSKHVRYRIRKQGDGSYVILEYNGKRLTIHGWYDTYEEAHDEWVDLHRQPTQAEIMQFFHDLRNSNTKN